VAASDERTRLLELFEVQNDEGPCRDCYRLGQPVVNVDLSRAGARCRPWGCQELLGADGHYAPDQPGRRRAQRSWL